MADLFAGAPPNRPVERRAPSGRLSEAERRDVGHCCRVCGVWAGFGFKNAVVAREPYRWACAAHRDQVEALS